MAVMQLSVSERFWRRVNKTAPDGCWLWTAGRSSTGYGTFSVRGRATNCHRYAYETLIGPVPKGMHLDHLCHNKACVNPAHLEPVTPGENLRRHQEVTGTGRYATHCPHGHEFTPENSLMVWAGGYLCRRCRACVQARDRERWCGERRDESNRRRNPAYWARKDAA